MLEPKRMLRLEPEVDARARIGCLGQNWMPCESKD